MPEFLFSQVECLCGRMAVIPEGGLFPMCPSDGRRMMPPLDYERRVIYRVAVDDYEDAWKTAHARQYTDDELRAALEARGYPTEPQDWPKVVAPDSDTGIPTIPTAPWELLETPQT